MMADSSAEIQRGIDWRSGDIGGVGNGDHGGGRIEGGEQCEGGELAMGEGMRYGGRDMVDTNAR